MPHSARLPSSSSEVAPAYRPARANWPCPARARLSSSSALTTPNASAMRSSRSAARQRKRPPAMRQFAARRSEPRSARWPARRSAAKVAPVSAGHRSAVRHSRRFGNGTTLGYGTQRHTKCVYPVHVRARATSSGICRHGANAATGARDLFVAADDGRQDHSRAAARQSATASAGLLIPDPPNAPRGGHSADPAPRA